MRYSGQADANPDIFDWTKDYRAKGNGTFFAAVLENESSKVTDTRAIVPLVLIGARDIPGVTLRQAQAVLRWDRRPSHWSNVLVLDPPASTDDKDLRKLPVREVALHPRDGRFPQPENNGVSSATLGDYYNQRHDANAGVVVIEAAKEKVDEVRLRVANPNLDRGRFDLWGALGIWQAYLWQKDTRPNPLVEGVPIPGALYVQMLFEAMGMDVAPAADARNIGPEHLWNLAKWWNTSMADRDGAVRAYCVLRDPGCTLMEPEED